MKNQHRSVVGNVLVVALFASASLDAVGQASPSAFTTGYRYDAMRRVTGTLLPDPDGTGTLRYLATRITYSAAGRPVKTEAGELQTWQSEAIAPASWVGFTVYSTVETTYDPYGRQTSKTTKGSDGAVVSVLQFSYDTAGRLQCATTRMNPAAFASLPASACTLGASGSMGADRVSQKTYDTENRVLREIRAAGTPLQQDSATYTYTVNGMRASVKDARSNLSSMTYDGFDRLQRLTFPSPTTAGTSNASDYEQYGYDANSNRVSLRKRDGSTISYQYDGLNRVLVKVVPEIVGVHSIHTRDVYYGYDLRGFQTFARFDSAGGEGVSTSYNGFGERQSQTTNMGGVSRTLGFQSDANGNRTQLTYPDGNYMIFGYDGLNRLQSILDPSATVITAYSFDAAGRRVSLTGGVSTTYTYDNASRLSSLTHDLGGTINDVTYSYQTYNPANQILSQSRNNDVYAWQGAVASTTNYSVNGLNQYTAAGAGAPGYDARGNMTWDGVGTTYLYDVENRLVSVSGASSATLTHDPLGRLFQVAGSSITSFLYDGDELLGEYDGAGTLLRRYVHGAASDDPVVWYEGSGLGTRRHIRTDHQGSVIAVTDSAGNYYAINSYDEYGAGVAANIGTFRYTGQAYLPQIGLHYYKARMYSAVWGRFLQTDPIGYQDDLNLYAYVGNDPINRNDPSGKTCTTIVGGGYDCKVDRFLRDGKEVSRNLLTKSELAKVTKFEASYTAAANRLAANGERATTVVVDGKSMTMTAARAVSILSGRTVVGEMRRATGVVGGAMETPRAGVSIGNIALPETKVFGTAFSANSAWQQMAIVHDGAFHGSAEESESFWRIPGDQFHRDHVDPYSNGAYELLK